MCTLLRDPLTSVASLALFQLGIVTRKVETPKAVLFAKFLDGESLLPLDREVLEDLKKEGE